MNLLDLAIVLIFGLLILTGFYRGFINTAASVCACILSLVLALLFMPLLSTSISEQEDVYTMMQYYLEGSEYITDVEAARKNIVNVSSDELDAIVTAAKLPYPLGNKIKNNVAKESFATLDIHTVGGYFNQTMIDYCMNILSFLILYLIIRIVFSLGIHGADYARGFPVLLHSDGLIGAGVGLIRSLVVLFVVFTVIPIVLLVLPFDFIEDTLLESFFGPFFYRSNFILSLIPAA